MTRASTCSTTRASTCITTRASMVLNGASTCSNTCASTCITTCASTCITTRASTCHYTHARLLFKNMHPGQTQPLDLVWRNWVSTSHRRFFLTSYHIFQLSIHSAIQLLAFTSEDTIFMNNCHLGDHGLCCWRSGAFIFVLKILFYLIYEKKHWIPKSILQWTTRFIIFRNIN